MSSRSSSTPSEGEIVESDFEKATTRGMTIRGTSVDRHSRLTVSVSRSPSPVQSPRIHRSRTRSRSPYRERRGEKRPFEDEQGQDRGKNDPRRFKVRYEDRPYEDRRRTRNGYEDLDRSDGSGYRLPYDDHRSHGSRDKRRRTRSRSPRPSAVATHHGQHTRSARTDHPDRRGWDDRNGREYQESRNRAPKEQSVSGRGYPSIATASAKHNAETPEIQSKHYVESGAGSQVLAAEHQLGVDKFNTVNENSQLVDEATLIEERRKRREAIKAKHRGQATPLLLQALAPRNLADATDQPSTTILAKKERSSSTHASPPSTPKDGPGQESPTAFAVARDSDLANTSTVENGYAEEDEPSAADYDPTMDMQEDKLRQDQQSHTNGVSATAYDETLTTKQEVLLPEGILADNTQGEIRKSAEDFDMFGDEDDMFAEAPVAPKVQPSTKDSAKAILVPQSQAVEMGMLDDWDDLDGYYKAILGELLDNRYHIQSNLGKGMFSGVVRATDERTKGLVAIKIIRNNETMKKAGVKEIEILQKVSHADPDDKKHVIRLERYFEHKGHLCMVFENLSINLREVLKKFGRDVGINLKAVRAYAHQMFLGLSLLRKCNILHADLKPDNMLVNESRNVLKVCDLGSASDASENEITQYLVSRFYRAPEIILGLPYDFGIDVWSIGCTLFELYTGKILFTGRSNNQMLRAIMECRGKFSHKILRKAEFAPLHFDDLLNFRSVEKDKLTNKDVVKILNFAKPTRDLRTRLMANAKGMEDGELKDLNLFIDLLDRCLNLNPEKRCTPNEALKHPFITRAR